MNAIYDMSFLYFYVYVFWINLTLLLPAVTLSPVK